MLTLRIKLANPFIELFLYPFEWQKVKISNKLGPKIFAELFYVTFWILINLCWSDNINNVLIIFKIFWMFINLCWSPRSHCRHRWNSRRMSAPWDPSTKKVQKWWYLLNDILGKGNYKAAILMISVPQDDFRNICLSAHHSNARYYNHSIKTRPSVNYARDWLNQLFVFPCSLYV